MKTVSQPPARTPAPSARTRCDDSLSTGAIGSTERTNERDIRVAVESTSYCWTYCWTTTSVLSQNSGPSEGTPVKAHDRIRSPKEEAEPNPARLHIRTLGLHPFPCVHVKGALSITCDLDLFLFRFEHVRHASHPSPRAGGSYAPSCAGSANEPFSRWLYAAS